MDRTRTPLAGDPAAANDEQARVPSEAARPLVGGVEPIPVDAGEGTDIGFARRGRGLVARDEAAPAPVRFRWRKVAGIEALGRAQAGEESYGGSGTERADEVTARQKEW